MNQTSVGGASGVRGGFSAILWRDLRREARSKDAALAGGVLLALFLVLDIFAFHGRTPDADAAAAAIWAPLVFAAAALCGRSLAADHDRATLDLLRSLPVSLVTLGASRTLVHALLLAALGLLSAGAAAALFGVAVSGSLVAVLLLASLGIAVTGTLAGGIAAQARSREALLPVLLVPALAPLLNAGVSASLAALSGATLGGLRTELLLMVAYDLVACGAAWLLWPFVLEGD